MQILNTEIEYNSIGTPEVLLEIKNLSSKTVKAFRISVDCYDDFNRPVNRYLGNSNVFIGISQDNNLNPGASQSYLWNLNLYDHTTNVKNVKIIEVSFTDSTIWTAK